MSPALPPALTPALSPALTPAPAPVVGGPRTWALHHVELWLQDLGRDVRSGRRLLRELVHRVHQAGSPARIDGGRPAMTLRTGY